MRFRIVSAFALCIFLTSVSLVRSVHAQSDVATAVKPAQSDEQSKPDASDGSLFVRVKKSDAGKPLALQTAIVRYEGQPGTAHDGAVVDLVGVVHIGEKDYYAELKQRLSTYQSVLYELVAPDGTRIRPEDLRNRRSVLASMQTGMKDMLNLEYQLEQIDYLAENFRHADMSPDEFVMDLQRRGDSIVKMVARMMGAGVAAQATGVGSDAGILLALFSKDRTKMMKRAMAKQLVEIDLVTAGMNDANGENTLIKGRNAKAFTVLKQELTAGKDKVAVFYGAGHLPDMADRLQADFGMKPTQTDWLDAWDLTTN